ncbi:MAG TPA: hypothetical protein VNE21_07930, partial [Mycobacteriales bacterium]|nr:hypothetical protein [Mycobacteriales bacterium]
MSRRSASEDRGEQDLTISARKQSAAGLPAVAVTVRQAHREMGVARSVRTLLAINQPDGFDCPGCAWPEPERRKHLELCENGAKAVAEEATRSRIEPEFFAEHSIPELLEHSDYWLGSQGRLTTPMYKPVGADHYLPIGFDAALDLVAEELRALG